MSWIIFMCVGLSSAFHRALLKINPSGSVVFRQRPLVYRCPLHLAWFHSCTVRSRMALPITLTDDSAIAAAAMMGESRMPKTG